MLWRASEVDGYAVAAGDGEIGSVDDLLFDDARWTVRWLVAETGTWLSGRKVLLPAAALGRPDAASRRFPVSLTRRQVEDSPAVDADRPVSRQAEAAIYGHYGGTPYWSGGFEPSFGFLAGGGPVGGFLLPPDEREPAAGNKPGRGGDPHLRSAGDTAGHAIRATDGDIGHVEDFLVDDADRAIRYMVVDTRNWLPGRRVLVSPRWIRDIDWAGKRVLVDLARQAVRDSPEYDPEIPVERRYEERLHAHYGRPGYWP